MIADNEDSRTSHISTPFRYTLGIMLLLITINAFAGGYYGMAGPKNIPREWLGRTPFSNYLIPSLFLFLIIEGSSLVAAIPIFRRHPLGTKIAFFSAAIIIFWLIVQVMMIGYVSWMQPATASIALVIILLTSLISKNAF